MFTQRDKAAMVEAVKNYGNAFAMIAKEYFHDCDPPVTRTDIANYVKNNPHLKNVAKIGIFVH